MTNISDISGDAAYRTVEGTAAGRYEEKKSRFIAAVGHVASEDGARAFIEGQRAEHPEARHHVYAYVLRAENRVRYSDDREPKRTAGLPVLDVLEHSGLRDVICVVSRYFGGVKLGTGGLVRAYTKAAQDALSAARIVSLAPCRDILASVGYAEYEALRPWLEERGTRVLDVTFADDVTLTIRERAETADALCAEMRDLCQGRIELVASEARLRYVQK